MTSTIQKNENENANIRQLKDLDYFLKHTGNETPLIVSEGNKAEGVKPLFIREIDKEKANSWIARDEIKDLNALVSKVDAIIAKNTQTAKTTSTENTNPDPADEIRKFKKLADDGIITQDEFETKKKQLLGL